MKQKFIDYYMDVAERTSQLSYAKRLQVGAVIVKENRILSYGYNGMPSGWDNNCEVVKWAPPYDVCPDPHKQGYTWNDLDEVWEKLETKPEVLHAESNAIAKVSASSESSENATMFCTHAPCMHCAKIIFQSGIKNLYYRDTYRETNGLEFLQKSGINVIRHSKQS